VLHNVGEDVPPERPDREFGAGSVRMSKPIFFRSPLSGYEKSPVLACDLYEVAYCDDLPCDGFDLLRRHHLPSFSAVRMAAIGSRSVHGHGNSFAP
jgi:hypothetical protein